MLFQTGRNMLISPAFCQEYLFVVEWNCKDSSSIVKYKFSEDVLSSMGRVGIIGLAPDSYVWHIDIFTDKKGNVRGLFVIRKKEQGDRLNYLGLFLLQHDEWIFEKNVSIPEKMRSSISYVYKSTVIPELNKIIVSAKDKKGRYVLFDMDYSL
jgi:hypothetical protein